MDWLDGGLFPKFFKFCFMTMASDVLARTRKSAAADTGEGVPPDVAIDIDTRVNGGSYKLKLGGECTSGVVSFQARSVPVWWPPDSGSGFWLNLAANPENRLLSVRLERASCRLPP